MKKLLIVFLLTAAAFVSSNVHAIDRQKPQFQTDDSYLIFPLPYSKPGIGSGMVVVGLAANIFETNVDAYLLKVLGDAEGTIGAVQDIHILPETLIFDYQYQQISKASVNQYANRGMETAKDDYTQAVVDKADGYDYRLTLSLFDRRLELYAGAFQQE